VIFEPDRSGWRDAACGSLDADAILGRERDHRRWPAGHMAGCAAVLHAGNVSEDQ
jgi:hypothetical protein